MKRCFISMLAALLLVLGILPSGMAAAKGDFKIKNGVLTAYNGSDRNIIIPGASWRSVPRLSTTSKWIPLFSRPP